MSLRMQLGRRGSLLADGPDGLRLVRNDHPILLEDEKAALERVAGVQAVTLPATWHPEAGGGRAPAPPRPPVRGPRGGVGGSGPHLLPSGPHPRARRPALAA